MSDLCRYCKKPVVDGEARYTAFEPEEAAHYDCYRKSREDFNSALKDFEAASDRAKRALDELRKIR